MKKVLRFAVGATALIIFAIFLAHAIRNNLGDMFGATFVAAMFLIGAYGVGLAHADRKK